MTDERELLATKVKDFRDGENLNQFDFAEDCGISKETLSLIEREQANVRLDTFSSLPAEWVSQFLNYFSIAKSITS